MTQARPGRAGVGARPRAAARRHAGPARVRGSPGGGDFPPDPAAVPAPVTGANSPPPYGSRPQLPGMFPVSLEEAPISAAPPAGRVHAKRNPLFLSLPGAGRGARTHADPAPRPPPEQGRRPCADAPGRVPRMARAEL